MSALPQRIIGVLYRQVSPLGSLSFATVAVSNPQISQQRSDRPAVCRDMVHHRREDVFVVGQAEQSCPQRDLGAEIEGVLRCGIDGFLQACRSPTHGIDDVPAEFRLPGGDNDLAGYTVRCGEHRSQALVAVHHIGQRGTQRVDVERAADPEGSRHVVNR